MVSPTMAEDDADDESKAISEGRLRGEWAGKRGKPDPRGGQRGGGETGTRTS